MPSRSAITRPPLRAGAMQPGSVDRAQRSTLAEGVLLTIVWSGVVAFIAFKIADLTIGLRVSEEEEREGLDISSHGETAYNR
jgi:ammonia channel protein AmtB